MDLNLYVVYRRLYKPFIDVHKRLLWTSINNIHKFIDLINCKIRHNTYFKHLEIAVILKVAKNRRLCQ